MARGDVAGRVSWWHVVWEFTKRFEQTPLASDNIWFAPEVPTRPDPMNGGLRQYIRPLSGTAMVPGHDGLRTPRSS